MIGLSSSSARTDLAQRLTEISGPGNVSTDRQMTKTYEVDGLIPTAVVFATTTEQVSRVVRAGNESEASIIPWGSGSKQTVGPCLSAADIVLCLKPINQIIELNTSNFSVEIGAGLSNAALQKQVGKHNLFFPFDPLYLETSTIGGELATNASGPWRAAYGTARDIVLGITAVTPTGDVIHTGGRTMKNVAGIDLCKLLIGSWGTLGIITETVLRLFPLPKVSRSLCLTFAGIEDAFRLVHRLLSSPLTPGAVELIDGVAGRNSAPISDSPLAEDEVQLLIDISGNRKEVEWHLKEISALAEENQVRHPTTLEDEAATCAWNTYRGAHQAILSAAPSTFQGKASVPLIRQTDMFKAIKEIGQKYQVAAGIRGHCYNGILYPYVVAGDDHAVNIINDLKKAAADLGGFFIVESAPFPVRKSAGALPQRSDHTLMKRLKTEFDPNNILNPGKLMGDAD